MAAVQGLMLRPALVLQKIQRVIEEAKGPRWRPSSYVPIPDEEDARWHELKTPRGKGVIDAALLFAVMLVLGLFFTSGHDVTDSVYVYKPFVKTPEFEMFNLLGDFDGSGIKNMCEHKRFQEGLYFRCDEGDGGFGNLRNSILSCARYAIETGAQMVAPHLHLRSKSDLADLRGPLVNMTYMFDYHLYKERLEANCPGFHVYDSVEDIPVDTRLSETKDIYDPVDLHEHGGEINYHLLDHRTETREWIFKQLGIHPTAKTPVLVKFARAFFQFHKTFDPYNVWHEWGKLLYFQPESYKLAADVLKLMAKSEAGDFWKPVIMRQGFRYVGQHLRTEEDASPQMRRFGFEPQMNAAIVTCKESNITDLYIASGDAGEAARAAAYGKEHGITVHTKYSIMTQSAKLQKAIVDLTFDQQALIDFLILSKCTQFVGVDSSSFSANLAVTRHATLEGETHWEEFRDELSFLLGDLHQWLRDGIWP